MKTGCHIKLILVWLMLGSGISLAKDLRTYRIGNVAEQNIVAPISFDVVDATATTALKISRAGKTPSVFRHYSGAAGDLSLKVKMAFDVAHSNFLNAVQNSFHRKILNQDIIGSSDFGYFVTAFNIGNKTFPIPTALAVSWARGQSGDDEKRKLLDDLLPLAQKLIRPDKLPDGFADEKTVRLIPVAAPYEKLTLADLNARGQTVQASDLLPLSQVRALFRSRFAETDEQLLVRILAAWIKPNCTPDMPLTQLSRKHTLQRLVVAEHYAAGQIIVPRGGIIDSQAKAALDALAEKSNPDHQEALAAAQVSAAAMSQKPPEQTTGPKTSDVGAPVKTAETPDQISYANTANGIPVFEVGLLVGAAILGMILTVWIKYIFWRRSKVSTVAVANKKPSQTSNAHQAALSPELTKTVRETLIQELAGQRRDLLFVQQLAAADVARLVQKMDQMHMAIHERLETYKTQIEDLEAELAARTIENRDLIKLKIELIRERSQRESMSRFPGAN